jgi:hypothetical protein
LWVDSPHHALIIKKIIESRGIPQDLSPYLPIQFNYHFGFHGTTALFTSISGLPIESAILVFGQLLNAAISLSIYRLVKVLWRDWRRAIIAALIVALFSQMPAFYISWGRYTLLTGLVVLPLALATLFDVTHNRGGGRKSSFQLIMFVTGTFLSHYFAGILFLIFLLALSIDWILIKNLFQYRTPPPLKIILRDTALGMLLVAPWLGRMIRHSPEVQTTPLLHDLHFSSEGWAFNPAYLFQLAGPLRSYILLLIGLIGAILLIRSKRHLSLVFWTTILLLGSTPIFDRPSGMRPDHFIIILFLPASILASHAIIQFLEKLETMLPQIFSQIILMSLLLLGSLWGLDETHDILNPITILATADDREAIDWIQKNTPEDARFFINVEPWQENLYRGVDGAIWILPSTGRWTILPPITYALGDQRYIEKIAQIAKQAQQIVDCSPELWTIIEQEKITHIYLKNNAGSLQSKELDNCMSPQYNDFKLHQAAQFGTVRIFQVETGTP